MARPAWVKLGLGIAVLAVASAAAIFVFAPKIIPLLPGEAQRRLGLSPELSEIRTRHLPEIRNTLAQFGLKPGAPVHIRIFKEDSQLELYVQGPERLHLLRRYPICAWSGRLGPKLKEGDHQAPEGFYNVDRAALNPNSRFHLSFNLGFPNGFDRAHGRTGSFLMVHGDCVSVGCYAMTDPVIEEIYLLVEAALKAGQRHVPVHIFPFRMTDARMARAAANPAHAPWLAFWRDLKPAYDLFETTGRVPRVTLDAGRYRVDLQATLSD